MLNEPIIRRFENIVEKYPQNIALITKEINISYRELNEKANQLAYYIEKIETSEKFSIGIYLQPSIDMIVSILAVLKLGIPYVPLDPSYPEERIKYIVNNSKISQILTSSNLTKKIQLNFVNKIFVDKIDYIDLKSNNLNKKLGEIVYILYTSGTAGNPKGVEVYQTGLSNYLSYSCDNYIINENNLNNPASFIYLPLVFDASITSLFSPLMVGRSIVIPSKRGIEIFDDEIIQNNSFDFVKMTPAHLLVLKERLDYQKIKNWTYNVVVGGEALLKEHVLWLKEIGFEWNIINEYGPTETVVGSSTFSFSLKDEIPDKIPIGKPIYNTQFYIVDKNLNILPENEIGEIIITGEGVSKGYLENETLTKEKFINNFLLKNNRAYRTGDLGYYKKNGDYYYEGRIDEQIKIQGYRIEISEIETQIRKIPTISNVAIIVTEDTEKIKTLEVFYVSSKYIEPEYFYEYLKKYLPSYMIPNKYVHIRKIPLTINGKIDKKTLLKYREEKMYSKAKLTKMEEKILPFWKEILKIDNVLPEEKFCYLGGHSLLAVLLISKINKEFSVKIPILELYPNGTLREIANKIEKQLLNRTK